MHRDAESFESRFNAPMRGVSLVTILTVVLAFVAPRELMGQLPPSVDPDLLLEVEVQGQPGGTYSRFELEMTASPDGTNAMDPEIPSSMPEVVLSAFIQEPWGEELAAEIVADEALWVEIADVQDLFEPYLHYELDNLSPSQEAELDAAATAALAGLDLALPPAAGAILGELEAAFQANGAQGLGVPAFGGTCLTPFLFFLSSTSFALLVHIVLIDAVRKSPATCMSPVPAAKVLCGPQIAAWVVGLGGILGAKALSIKSRLHLEAFMEAVAADEVGQRLDAAIANVDIIGRESKLNEQEARRVIPALGLAALNATAIMVMGAADPYVLTLCLSELLFLGAAAAFWSEEHTCMRRVIAPRQQAGIVRNRLFVETENGQVPLSVGGALTLTALPRDLAKASVIEIDVDQLYAADPALISEFDEVNQSQSLIVSICEGVVAGPDPGALSAPFQNADTDYWIGDYSASPSCVAPWWKGIEPGKTAMVKPLISTTIHRACESIGLIDNDNNGVPDASFDEHCHLVSEDPAGEVEEDIARVPVGDNLGGKTAWSHVGVDMLCNSAALDLVSPLGLTDKFVQQEWVSNTASCWTRESDGVQVDAYHPQDSTQIRFVLKDSSWGEPRPRGCFDYNPQSAKWECNENPGCGCLPPGGGAGGGPSTLP